MKRIRLLVGLLVLSGLIVPLLAGPATANGIGYVIILPEEQEAAPNGTFEVAVQTSSYPQAASGAVKARIGISFNSEYLEVTGMEIPEPGWLEGGEETNVRTTQREIDNEQGFAILAQERDPWRGGVTQSGTFVRFTFHVDEAAPLGTELRLQIASAEIQLTDGMFQQVEENQAEVTITESPDEPKTATEGTSDATTESASNSDAATEERPTIENTRFDSNDTDTENGDTSQDSGGQIQTILYAVIIVMSLLTGSVIFYAKLIA